MVGRNIVTATWVLGAAALLSACGSTPVNNKQPTGASAASNATPVAPKSTPPTSIASPVAPVVVKPAYLDAANPLSQKRSVYFDYDNFAVKSDYQGLIEMHGKFLSGNPKVSIRVEGNADERGSAEYNLALGQKRAEAVVKALKVFGVREDQMEAVSWGEEKPADAAHTETAYAKNRRADIVYPSR